MKRLMENIIAAGERYQSHTDGDYRGENGLLRCGVCHAAKQARIDFGAGLGVRTVPVSCRCDEERENAEREKDRQQQILQRKRKCFTYPGMLQMTFEKDNGKQEKLQRIREYAENWEENRKQNIGLLLIGDVGTGKTYAACALANRLCEQGKSVRFVNPAEVLNTLQNCGDRNAYIRELSGCELLVIDDFGIQRETTYAAEQICNLIDSRYRSGKPLVVTTNMTYHELRTAEDPAFRRIGDRLQEMCVPILFEGESMRSEEGKEKKKQLLSLTG